MIFVALPLVVVASGGIASAAWVARDIVRAESRTTWWRLALVGLVAACVVIGAVGRAGAPMPQPEGGPEWSGEQMAARAFLQSATAPHSFIATDDPLLAFAANRLVPPPLTVASYKAIRLNYLTTEDLVVSILRYDVEAALFATDRLDLLPGFEDWISAMSVQRRSIGDMRAYLPGPLSSPQSRIDARLGEGIVLTGYSVSANEPAAGDTLAITLYWAVDGPVTEDFTVFVHVTGNEDALVTQHDGPPLMGIYPTSRWSEGVLLPDRHVLTIPPETPPGSYDLLTGMYGRPSLMRLPAYDERGRRWPDDVVRLGTVSVVPSSGSG
jgi:hypothetical protein